MTKLFYSRLAATNIQKNRRTYLPFLLTCTFTVSMYYMITSLSQNPGLDKMLGSDVLRYTLSLGGWVTAIFSAIFLFYTNSFLIKRRKKEFGLFNILGMEKKHLAKVIALETLYVAVISLALGLGLGVLLEKLLFLVLLKMFETAIPLGFSPSLSAVFMTLALFGAIFLLIFLNTLRQIRVSSPIELLHSGNVGEREPKTRWIMAVLGAISLGAGYYISVTTKNPVAAMGLFFVAVLLVIIGTYLLFTAGSIALLKSMRKNKRFYYTSKHFTSVSGMLYRMKQNAVGLANICILSTAVLVMVSSTLSMWMGMQGILDTRYPRELLISSRDYSQQAVSDLHRDAQQVLDSHGLQSNNAFEYTYLTFSLLERGDTFTTSGADTSSAKMLSSMNSLRNLFFVTLEDYNRVTGQHQSLEDGQVLLYSNRESYPHDTLRVFDTTFTVKQRVDDFPVNGFMAANIASSHFLVVKDLSVIQQLDSWQKAAYGENASDIKLYWGFDLTGSPQQKIAFYEDLQTTLHEREFEGALECRSEAKQSFVSLYGGLFFIGVFLGLLFTVAAILIIYYKQVSEGYDDRERFVIMQQVGMSHSEVRRSIHAQIMTVFFLPLITAGIHIAFAFPVITRLLAVFSLTDVGLFALCTVGTFLAFGLLYALIYGLTAKVYYRIVRT